MNFIEKWFVKRIRWVKSVDSLSLQELYALQQKVGNAISKKLEENK